MEEVISSAIDNIAVDCAALGFTSSKNSNFPLVGDVGEPGELLMEAWGPGAAGAYPASLQSSAWGWRPLQDWPWG